MEQHAGNGHLCDRCRVGLYFPGIEQPSLAPEVVLNCFPWAKDATNPSGPYLQKYGQHQFECDFYHEDVLPELVELERTASQGCEFCQLLRSAILSFTTTSPTTYDAIQIHLDYFWDADPKKSQIGSTITRWVLQAKLLLHDPNIKKRREGLPQDVDVSGWVSGCAIFWPLSGGAGERKHTR